MNESGSRPRLGRFRKCLSTHRTTSERSATLFSTPRRLLTNGKRNEAALQAPARSGEMRKSNRCGSSEQRWSRPRGGHQLGFACRPRTSERVTLAVKATRVTTSRRRIRTWLTSANMTKCGRLNKSEDVAVQLVIAAQPKSEGASFTTLLYASSAREFGRDSQTHGVQRSWSGRL